MLVEHLSFLDIAALFSVSGNSIQLRDSLVALGALIIVAKLFEEFSAVCASTQSWPTPLQASSSDPL